MKLHLEEGSRFDCQSRGHCCRADWTVRAAPSKADRLNRTGPPLPIVNGRLPKKDGGCVFLQSPSGLCGVHQDKPLDCQAFPYLFTATPDGLHVSLSRFCPSVRQKLGRPLEQQKDQLARLARQAKPAPLVGPFTVAKETKTGWTGYRLFEAELLRRLKVHQRPAQLFENLAGRLMTHHESWGRVDLADFFAEAKQLVPWQPEPLAQDLLQETGLVPGGRVQADATRDYLQALVGRKFLLQQKSLEKGAALLCAISLVLERVETESALEKLELLFAHSSGDWSGADGAGSSEGG